MLVLTCSRDDYCSVLSLSHHRLLDSNFNYTEATLLRGLTIRTAMHQRRAATPTITCNYYFRPIRLQQDFNCSNYYVSHIPERVRVQCSAVTLTRKLTLYRFLPILNYSIDIAPKRQCRRQCTAGSA